jgi:uncharacterized protein
MRAVAARRTGTAAMDVVSANFEWASSKSAANLRKRGISFETAAEIFDRPHLTLPLCSAGKKRWIALGYAAGGLVVAIYSKRNGRIRIISARMARTDEREIFTTQVGDTS